MSLSFNLPVLVGRQIAEARKTESKMDQALRAKINSNAGDLIRLTVALAGEGTRQYAELIGSEQVDDLVKIAYHDAMGAMEKAGGERVGKEIKRLTREKRMRAFVGKNPNFVEDTWKELHDITPPKPAKPSIPWKTYVPKSASPTPTR